MSETLGKSIDSSNIKNETKILTGQDIFGKLQDKDKIDKEVFLKLYNEYYNKLSLQDKDIFLKLQDSKLFQNTKLDSNFILSILLFLDKNGDKYGKRIEIFADRKPTLIKKLINGFYDEVKRLLNIEQKEDELEQKGDELEQKGELNDKQIEKAVKEIKEQISSQAPEYEGKIKEKQEQIKKQVPSISEEKAYLLAFSYIRQEEPSLNKKIKLSSITELLIKQIEQEYTNIKINSILEEKEIKQEFNKFVNSTEYNNELSNKLEKANFDLETQRLLSEKYPSFVKEALNRIADDNKLNYNELLENYQNYLNGENTKYDKIYEKLGQQLVKKFNEQLNIFPQEYKKIAIHEYTKSIFSMLDKAVGMYSLQANFEKSDKFNIENGNILLSLSYDGVPLDIEVTKDGNILMTNYLARENQDTNGLDTKADGSFQVKKTKVNIFFSFVGLQELLSVNKFSYKDLLEGGKDIKISMEEQIKKLVESKIKKNEALGNISVMKEELAYHIENQKIAYDMIKYYRPPLENNYLEGNGKIGEDKQGLFILMNRLSRTANLDERTQDVLEKFYSNEKIKYLLSNLDKVKIDDKPLSTYEFFKKIGFLGTEGKLNLNKIEKFASKIEKVNTELDLKQLPEIEDLEWEILPSGKIRLKEAEDIDELSLFSDSSLILEENKI